MRQRTSIHQGRSHPGSLLRGASSLRCVAVGRFSICSRPRWVRPSERMAVAGGTPPVATLPPGFPRARASHAPESRSSRARAACGAESRSSAFRFEDAVLGRRDPRRTADLLAWRVSVTVSPCTRKREHRARQRPPVVDSARPSACWRNGRRPRDGPGVYPVRADGRDEQPCSAHTIDAAATQPSSATSAVACETVSPRPTQSREGVS